MTSVNPPTPARRESAHTPLAGTLSRFVDLKAFNRAYLPVLQQLGSILPIKFLGVPCKQIGWHCLSLLV